MMAPLSFRARKLLKCLAVPPYRQALLRHWVAAGIEHEQALMSCSQDFDLIVDVGANRGQFALVAGRMFPAAEIISIEPLRGPAEVCRAVFAESSRHKLVHCAVGPFSGVAEINVSGRDDSSSLLGISAMQAKIFPGTDAIGVTSVDVRQLSEILNRRCDRGLLKIDVQGFELQVLIGSEDLLGLFDAVYIELSTVELYEHQAFAGEVICWLSDRNFRLARIFNPSFAPSSGLIQADFLFERAAGR